MIRCLDKDELAQVLDFVATGHEPHNPELSLWVDCAAAWQDELIGFNYFVAQILLARKRAGADYSHVLTAHSVIGDRMWFTLEEFDIRFVEYMMRNMRDSGLTLAEDLVELGSKMRRFEYDNTVRV